MTDDKKPTPKKHGILHQDLKEDPALKDLPASFAAAREGKDKSKS